LEGIEDLLIGGEALSVTHVREASRVLSAARIINGYGPTENTTFTCCYPIDGDVEDCFRGVPIGRPISNTRVYVLDRCLEPVPIGVVGELFTGGEGLSRGYLGAPDMSAAAFVPDPYALEAGRRMYRTGDLVRYRSDGNIEFVGRSDNQVKVRG